MTSFKKTPCINVPLVEESCDKEAPRMRSFSRRTQSLCQMILPTHSLRMKPVSTRMKYNTSMKCPDDVALSVSSSPGDKQASGSRNAVWRFRGGLGLRPQGRSTEDCLQTMEESLDSIEAFLKVVQTNPQARTLAQKELVKTLQATQSSSIV